MKPPTAGKKAAMVADYAAGMSSIAVARKHSSSSTAVLRYVREAGVGRSHEEAKARQRELREAAAAKEARRQARIRRYLEAREEAENTLTGGHWTPNGRGVQVWQPCFFTSAQTCTINHQENRNAA